MLAIVPTSFIVCEHGAEMDWPVTVSSSHDSGCDAYRHRRSGRGNCQEATQQAFFLLQPLCDTRRFAPYCF